MEGRDAIVLEGGLDVESVLEGLGLANHGIFARGDFPSPVVINLEQTSVDSWGTIIEGTRTS